MRKREADGRYSPENDKERSTLYLRLDLALKEAVIRRSMEAGKPANCFIADILVRALDNLPLPEQAVDRSKVKPEIAAAKKPLSFIR